jgi:ABC-2 type transport system ATP-binding protein
MEAIKVQGLTRRFAAGKNQSVERVAVDGLTFSVEKGEVFGFLGPNGAGKTTTVRMLCALIAPSAGEAWVNGHKLKAENMAIRQSVGILTESPGLYETLSARRNLLFFANLYGVPNPQAQVDTYLARFDLLNQADEPAGTFSKGMKQKVALIRALLHEPPVLFLDEPTSGLDPASAKQVREAIEALSGQGRTIFLCTHNLDEAERLCDRLGVINQGKLVALDTPEMLRRQLFGQVTQVRVENPSAGLAAQVAAFPFVSRVNAQNGMLEVTLRNQQTDTPDLVAALVGLGARIQGVAEHRHSLEEIYLSLMEREQ